MGHYYSPPPPIISATGAQPYAGNKVPAQIEAAPVDNPPFAWQQIPTWGARQVLPTLTSKLSPSLTAAKVDSPPPNHDFASTAEEIIDQWQAHSFDPQPFFGGRQPWQRRNLPPSLIAVAVNNPPFVPYGNDTWLLVIQRAWQPPDPLPTLRPDLTPSIANVPVNNPPFILYGDNAWLLSTVRAWIPPDPLPTLPGKLSPGIPGQSVDFPPFISEELDQAQAQIIRAWQLSDSQPQLPGKLSPGIPGQSVDNPPRLIRQQMPVQLDTPYPQITVKQVQPFVSSSAQQVFTSIWLSPVLASWQPADLQPTLPNKLNPSITAVQVDSPPFAWQQIPTWDTRRGLPQTTRFLVQPSTAAAVQGSFTQLWLAGVLQAWQPVDPPPVQRDLLTPTVTAVRVDNPPGIRAAQQFYQPLDPPYQQIAVKQVQPFVAASVQQVFTSVWLNPVLASWQPPDPSPTLPRNLNPSLTAVAVNNPVFTLYGNDTWLATILGTWQPPDPLPVQKGPLNPSLTAVRVDNPPFAWQMIPTWGVRTDVQQARKFVVQPGAAPSADNPPFGLLVTVIEPWITEPVAQQPRYKVTTGIPSDNPPFTVAGRGAITAELVRSWDPPDPLPVQKGPLSPALTAVQVNNPPFSHFGRAAFTVSEVLSWQPPDPQPVQKGPLPPSVTAVRVDNPPGVNLANTETMWTIIGIWEIPLPPQPQQTRYIVHIIPPPVGTSFFSYISSSYIQ